MMLFVLSVAIVAFVSYIFVVSFIEAASLLNSDNGTVVDPLVTSIPSSPQEWLSRCIPALGRNGSRLVLSPTTEVGQHKWLSHTPHQEPNHRQTTYVRNTYSRKLF